MFVQSSVLLIALAASEARAHCMGWAKGMYCLGGPDPNVDDPNTNAPVNPLYELEFEDWWFHHENGCDQAPPKDGDFLELPAGGSVTVEISHNRAQTTLSYDGQYASDWPDGQDHPEDWAGPGNPPDCIQEDGAMHTQNQSMAAGTALAISYESELSAVTMENLVVFTVLEHTPWKREATYQVPKNLPECSEEGCHCAFLWVPEGCGEPNIYMGGYKCKVTGATSTTPLALPAKPPVYCGDDESKCVPGSKQMIAWNQNSGNNVEGLPNGVTPTYSKKMGWTSGAQDDIFASSEADAPSSATESASISPTTSSSADPNPPPGTTLTTRVDTPSGITVTVTAPASTVTATETVSACAMPSP